MSKAKTKTLNVLFIIAILEVIGMIAWPVILGWGQLIGPAGKLLAAIFALPFVYYIIFAGYLKGYYSKRKPEDQNIGLMVFLNVLPLIFLVYILDIF
ncbi:hypothetical protein [Mucilaginibacter celer]|uniref:Uncharacterized protein n=1 Tax=Mucilaginibacter celer TaxID=2305508 RepID=A0A494VTQ9_9SPHI|nr:hypothetical protein [Mucilaginibacter celer]AYL98966.1 hypothetical protein HYN43_028470 [Mucilaginibacter celer]